MSEQNKIKKQFPNRESIPGTHQPDNDGRTSYGRDGEDTYKETN